MSNIKIKRYHHLNEHVNSQIGNVKFSVLDLLEEVTVTLFSCRLMISFVDKLLKKIWK